MLEPGFWTLPRKGGGRRTVEFNRGLGDQKRKVLFPQASSTVINNIAEIYDEKGWRLEPSNGNLCSKPRIPGTNLGASKVGLEIRKGGTKAPGSKKGKEIAWWLHACEAQKSATEPMLQTFLDHEQDRTAGGGKCFYTSRGEPVHRPKRKTIAAHKEKGCPGQVARCVVTFI